MIVRKNLSLKKILQYTWKRNAIILGYALLVCIVFIVFKIDHISIPSYPGTILGVAISILLSFRNNSAYDRWWEARKLWGGIVNDSRSLTRQLLSFTKYNNLEDNDPNKARIRQFVYRLSAFCHATNAHLRKNEIGPAIETFIPEEEAKLLSNQQNISNALLLKQSEDLQYLQTQGLYGEMLHAQMEDKVNKLCDYLGGCERIKNTVFPRQYSYFGKIFTWIFVFMLPHLMVAELGWFTIALTFVIGFIFMALEGIGGFIENPFENTIHDTPMNAISKTIEINLKQMLGEEDTLPETEKPINGFLY